jgi:signal transduction histidine kinase
MSRLSLRARVTLASALALAAGLAVLTFGINVLLERQLESDASSVLRQRADAALSTITLRSDRLAVVDAPNDEALDQLVWVYKGTKAVQRPPAEPGLQQAADDMARAGRPAERSAPGQVQLRVERAYAGRARGPIATVVVGLSLVPYDHTEHLALAATILLGLFVLVLGSLLSRRAVGNALRPVAEMTEHAADWSEHDLERRFNLGPPRDELTALSATLDGLLGRLGASLRHEQRFSAEIAHELRTPLSGIRGQAEWALRDERLTPDVREALDHIMRGIDRMDAVIETLLAAARRDAGVPRGAADAGTAATSAIDGIRPAADLAGVDIEVLPIAGRITVGADADVVAQALQPLLQNAVRHARHVVRLRIARVSDAVAFSVCDDGPGLNGSDAEALFEPGSSTTGGAGLGLPLARRLARSCGGDVVHVAGRDGEHFDLRLPAV